MSALQLKAAASVLEPVADEVVFVGGATVYLWIVNGRQGLAAEIEAAPPDLRAYVRDELVKLQTEQDFDYAVDSATAGYGPVGVASKV